MSAPTASTDMTSKTAKTDGRRERTKRTRAAIVAALTDLLDEGRIEPPASEIAERASVALRSIGQHFGSREELLLAVAEHHAARLPHGSIDPRGPLAHRLDAFVNERAQVLEVSRPMRLAAAVVAGRSPSVAEAVERAAADRRAASARVFAVEIEKAGDSEALERAIALVTSGRAWDALRGEMGLRPKAAKQQLSFMLRAVLEPR